MIDTRFPNYFIVLPLRRGEREGKRRDNHCSARRGRGAARIGQNARGVFTPVRNLPWRLDPAAARAYDCPTLIPRPESEMKAEVADYQQRLITRRPRSMPVLPAEPHLFPEDHFRPGVFLGVQERQWIVTEPYRLLDRGRGAGRTRRTFDAGQSRDPAQRTASPSGRRDCPRLVGPPVRDPRPFPPARGFDPARRVRTETASMRVSRRN